MQIETNRLIPLTKARAHLGKLVEKGKEGDFFIILDRGVPAVLLAPLDFYEMPQVEKRSSARRKISLGEMAKELRKQISWVKKGADSVKVLREIRYE
ncbi:MAG: hypothetical protein FJ044_01535 [Candidatus Cloacimonetes bacterium]|nr:hypothetical protein [Candidatus Cloacimonadota bacterium]